LQDQIDVIARTTGCDPVELADRAVESYGGFGYGEHVRIVEDDENSGAYAGETGYLVFNEVGAAKYGNVRTAVSVALEGGYDSPLEVDLANVEPIS
jgi:hypothetical protein